MADEQPTVTTANISGSTTSRRGVRIYIHHTREYRIPALIHQDTHHPSCLLCLSTGGGGVVVFYSVGSRRNLRYKAFPCWHTSITAVSHRLRIRPPVYSLLKVLDMILQCFRPGRIDTYYIWTHIQIMSYVRIDILSVSRPSVRLFTRYTHVVLGRNSDRAAIGSSSY